MACCLGIALLTEYMGLSIEMGAFIAGLMISEVEYSDQTLTYVEPIRDIFATLFFAAVGMLIDPVFIWNNLELILGLVALVFVGKFLIITPLVRAFGYSLKTSLIVGLGLAQIGEFSFVLASKGQVLGLVSRRVYLLILGTTAVEESDRIAPRKMPCVGEVTQPTPTETSVVIAIVERICRPPPPKLMPWTFFSSDLQQADLRENVLTGQKLSCQTNHKTQHRQTTVPSFSKVCKTELRCLIFHD